MGSHGEMKEQRLEELKGKLRGGLEEVRVAVEGGIEASHQLVDNYLCP